VRGPDRRKPGHTMKAQHTPGTQWHMQVKLFVQEIVCTPREQLYRLSSPQSS
jgi:hypothetical protein